MTLRTCAKRTWDVCWPSTPHRALHLTSAYSIRKKPDFAIVRTKQEEERRERKKKTLEKYTPSEEQATLIRETILIRSYLEKLEKELPLLKDIIPNKPYVPPTPSQYLRFRYEDDWRRPEKPTVARVELSIYVPDMVKTEMLTPQQEHLLILLSGEHYHPRSRTIRIPCLRYPDRAQNREWLRNLVLRLLGHLQTTKDFFMDLTPDFRHIQKETKALEKLERCKFPEAWLRRRDPSSEKEKLVGASSSRSKVTPELNPNAENKKEPPLTMESLIATQTCPKEFSN